MNPTDVYLHTYTGQTLVVLRYIDVQVEYESQALILLLIVKKCQGPSLFRQNWIEKIKLNLSAIHIVNMLSALHNLLQNIRIFSQSAGNTKRVSCSINHRSFFFKTRLVPYLLKEKIEKEFEWLQILCIITPVSFSEWAVPIVPVVKNDTNIRICSNYKVTINQASQTDSYPLPHVNDLFQLCQV